MRAPTQVAPARGGSLDGSVDLASDGFDRVRGRPRAPSGAPDAFFYNLDLHPDVIIIPPP